MNAITFVQASVMLILLTAGVIYTHEFLWRMKLKRLFSEDYLKAYNRNAKKSCYPFIPRFNSKKYNKASQFINKVGWDVSVDKLYAIKWALFVLGITIAFGIQTTNQYLLVNEVKQDVNYKKVLMDNFARQTIEAVKLEVDLFNIVDKNINKSSDIYNKENSNIYLEYIKNLLLGYDLDASEGVDTIAIRMFEKVKTVRLIQGDMVIYLWGFLISVILYMLPDLLGSIKFKLIEDKKDWEVLYCIYAFSIFGRLAPYSARLVIESMGVVTDVYKSLLNSLLEGVKKGTSARAFDEILAKTDNEDLYELIETMKLASDTGVLNAVGDMDVLAEQKLKWMEIKSIQRRKQKKLYAMTLVAVMFLFAGIYFSYGLTIIANPSNMIPK